MVSNSLLTNRNVRREIVQRINKLIDIPYLNERHEAALITIVVDMCFNALAGKTRPSVNKQRGVIVEEEDEDDDPDAEVMVEIPQAETEESAKEQMVRDINAKFNLPVLNEEQEAMLIRYFVDTLFKVKDEVDLEQTEETK